MLVLEIVATHRVLEYEHEQEAQPPRALISKKKRTCRPLPELGHAPRGEAAGKIDPFTFTSTIELLTIRVG